MCRPSRVGGRMRSVSTLTSGRRLSLLTMGELRGEWPLAGAPDATFFNPESGLVHVAIEEPGQIQTFDPRTGTSTYLTGSQRTHNGSRATGPSLCFFSLSSG